MYQNSLYAFLSAITVLCCCSCTGADKKIEGEPIEIVRLDHIWSAYKSGPSLSSRDSMLINTQLQVMGIDSINDKGVTDFASSQVIKMFAPAADSVFQDLNYEQKALGNIVARAAAGGIMMPKRTYAATVWGLQKSIIIDSNVVLIALNHYLGANHPAFAGWPEYKRCLKERKMLIYDLAEALTATTLPYAPSGKPTVLSRLLYEGALAHAKIAELDSPDMPMIFGYTKEQLNDVASNRRFMWERLVTNDLLHSSDPAVISALFDMAPVCTLISPDAPGRAVRLIGYDIVESYINRHPNVTLAFLLSPQFYDSPKTLEESNYAPK